MCNSEKLGIGTGNEATFFLILLYSLIPSLPDLFNVQYWKAGNRDWERGYILPSYSPRQQTILFATAISAIEAYWYALTMFCTLLPESSSIRLRAWRASVLAPPPDSATLCRHACVHHLWAVCVLYTCIRLYDTNLKHYTQTGKIDRWKKMESNSR